jgi:hypothetical protein
LASWARASATQLSYQGEDDDKHSSLVVPQNLYVCRERVLITLATQTGANVIKYFTYLNLMDLISYGVSPWQVYPA